MSELSNVKLRQAAVEKENLELRKRLARNFDFPMSAIFQHQALPVKLISRLSFDHE